MAVHAIDVASGFTWAELHSSSERNPRSRHCQALLHRLARELALAGSKLKTVSPDNGSEFVSGEFRAAVESHGARQRRIKAGRATSNGCVERAQLTILEERWRPSFAARWCHRPTDQSPCPRRDRLRCAQDGSRPMSGCHHDLG